MLLKVWVGKNAFEVNKRINLKGVFQMYPSELMQSTVDYGQVTTLDFQDFTF